MYILTRILSVFAFLLFYTNSFAQVQVPVNTLTVGFDIENHKLTGLSRISLPEGSSGAVNISGLKILSASVDGRPIVIEPGATEIDFVPENSGDVLSIEYEAVFSSSPASDNENNPGIVSGNLISSDGIVLLDRWYPSTGGPSIYRLSAVLPDDYEGISEAEEITVVEKTAENREFTYIFSHMLEKIDFIAAHYAVEKDTYKDTDIYAFFMPEDAGLAKNYIEHTKEYLAMYENLIGSFPFRRFSVVENILPTGYSMPTFTLLGKDVVKLPFIVDTSLGHEILHQWFGNLVYIDYKSGNWAEGLTTYLADHLYEKLKGRGWEYRKQSMLEFQSYVNDENDFPLVSFTARTGRASGAIGYRKSSMVFHMLKRLVGEEVFYASLKNFIGKNRFRPASWNDIKNAFESASEKDLEWFFSQWTETKGIPRLRAEDVELKYLGAKSVVSFRILQEGNNYNLALPVTLRTNDGEIHKTINIKDRETPVEIESEGLPLELIVDKGYDVFRKVSDSERPPVISMLLGASRKIFAVPAGKDEQYALTAGFFKGLGFTVMNEADIQYDDIRTASLIIPGTDTELAKKLFGRTERPEGDFFLMTKQNPFNDEQVVAVADGVSTADFESYVKKITHYGKYSTLAFKNGVNVSKTTEKSDRGLRFMLAKEISGIEVPRMSTLPDIISKIRDKKIIYVGEKHDRFEDHRVQLEVIRKLHSENRPLAVGMEMFQKSSQPVIDDYISGKIDEREFLKKSGYFNKWGMDYALYREILLFAREYKIPVIALNIDRKIVSRVADKGLRALSKEDMQKLPEYLNLSDSEYRNRLRDYFSRHRNSESRNFDFFYQAQVLWDETMAHNLNEFMKDHPGHQVVVIAGGGHMAFGSGIPKRAYRLNNADYAVLLNSEEVEDNIADFVLFPEHIETPSSPKLMAMLQEKDGKVEIADFVPGSVAKKAGLKRGDVILSMDSANIEGIDDVKIFLLYRKKGDSITVKVSRRFFIFGSTEKEFRLTL